MNRGKAVVGTGEASRKQGSGTKCVRDQTALPLAWQFCQLAVGGPLAGCSKGV